MTACVRRLPKRLRQLDRSVRLWKLGVFVPVLLPGHSGNRRTGYIFARVRDCGGSSSPRLPCKERQRQRQLLVPSSLVEFTFPIGGHDGNFRIGMPR